MRVGIDDTADKSVFRIPRDFLRRRSSTFRQELAEHDAQIIVLPDTSAPTMTEFFIWNFTPKPQLEDRLSFDEVVQLGVFAWKYQISALSNQVTDSIRAHVASGEWSLQATTVDIVYKAVPADSTLREVIRTALGQLPLSSIDGEEWERTFKDNPDLGWDTFKASKKEWSAREYLSDVCRFHNHEGIERQEGLCDGCPYAENDCYPIWEEYASYHDGEQDAVESLPIGEQPMDAFVGHAHAPVDHEPQISDAGHAAPVVEETSVETNGYLRDQNSEEVDGVNNGTETPLRVNGVKAASSTDEVQSESMDGDAATDVQSETATDKRDLVVPELNGHGIELKSNGKVAVSAIHEIESPKLTKKQLKKRARKMSVGHPNGIPFPGVTEVKH